MMLPFSNLSANQSISGTVPLYNSPYTYFLNNETVSGFTPLIPVMTNYTTPNGVASASVDSTTFGTEAWRAFDNNVNFAWISENNTPTFFGPPEWLQYQFATSKNVRGYAFSSNLGSTNCTMIDWSLSGSNDASTWVQLDKKMIPISTFPYVGTFFTINNTGSYLYYRLFLNNFSAPFVNIAYINRLQMYSWP